MWLKRELLYWKIIQKKKSELRQNEQDEQLRIESKRHGSMRS